MTINVTFESIEEMKGFAAMMAGQAAESQKPAVTQPETPKMAPIQTTPAETQGRQMVQAAPAEVNAGTVSTMPTTAPTYTLDELARAAMTLMDCGKQTELQQLLAEYGVEALPMLPQNQYGAFATGLRGLGAQI